jgi:hypothetical protein
MNDDTTEFDMKWWNQQNHQNWLQLAMNQMDIKSSAINIDKNYISPEMSYQVASLTKPISRPN